jgi:hypothetical protein
MSSKYLIRVLCLLLTGAVIIFFLGACSKAEEQAKAEKKADNQEAAAMKFEDELMTLQTLRPIFGEAKDAQSGIYDAIFSDNELFISYRFYTTEASEIDDDIGLELAPRIEKFYNTFKKPDRIVFGIYVSRPDYAGRWDPYCSFVVTRQIIKQSEWTTLIAKEFFKFVKDLKYSH